MTLTPDRSILLVEDSEDDVLLLRRVLKKSGILHPLVYVEDGQQAIDLLGGRGGFVDRTRYPLPFLVVLDLKLPLHHGHDVLAWARSRRELDQVCMVVLTSSAEPTDVQRAYARGANAYFVKGISAETVVELLAEIEKTWTGAHPHMVLNVHGSLRPRSSPVGA